METHRIKFYSLWLCLALVGVFIIQIFVHGFTELFFLTQDSLYQPWTFITAIFLHGSLAHLLYNLFALILFGIILERIIGSGKFIVLFFASGITANIISFSFYPSSLGASGAIMALIGCIAVLRPFMTMLSFGMILPMFFVALIWVAGSILGIFGFGNQSVGYLAHLSGLFIGIIYGLFLRVRYKGRFYNVYSSTRKIVIPEGMMRQWEDSYLRR